MRRGMRTVIFLLLLAPASSLAQAPREMRAAEIRENPGRFLDDTVEVVGFVTQYVDSDSGEATFYYLKDDWGGLVRVQTKGEPPAVGVRYGISGRVTMDTAVNDPYLVEEGRREVAAVQPAAIREGREGGEGRAGALEPSTGTAAAAAVAPVPFRGLAWSAGLVTLMAAGVVAFVRYGRGRKPAAAPAAPWPPPGAETAAPAPQQQILEGRTIRIHAPPKDTVKILPGWLEVVSQDDVVRQILFYRLKGDPVPEITFGRSPGRAYSHVQLMPQTVSARQARISFDGAQVRLINLASEESNPTRINGSEMKPEESRLLADGDLIAMGEVIFRYHKV